MTTITTVAKPDELAIPYALPQVPFMSPDLVHLNVMDKWLEDDNLWVPVTKTVSFKPLLLCIRPAPGSACRLRERMRRSFRNKRRQYARQVPHSSMRDYARSGRKSCSMCRISRT